MSSSTTVIVDGRGFWTVDDAFAVWLALLIESMSDPTDALAEQCEKWKVATGVTDYGMEAHDLDPESMAQLAAAASQAREAAGTLGDVPVERLSSWSLVDGLTVSGGHSRTGDSVEAARILEVADGFVALLDGTFPDDPADGAWFLGTGGGWRVMPYRGSPLPPDTARF